MSALLSEYFKPWWVSYTKSYDVLLGGRTIAWSVCCIYSSFLQCLLSVFCHPAHCLLITYLYISPVQWLPLYPHLNVSLSCTLMPQNSNMRFPQARSLWQCSPVLRGVFREWADEDEVGQLPIFVFERRQWNRQWKEHLGLKKENKMHEWFCKSPCRIAGLCNSYDLTSQPCQSQTESPCLFCDIRWSIIVLSGQMT